MKKLIITEGNHDSLFCQHFLSKSASVPPCKITEFSIPGKVVNCRKKETDKISSFLEKRSPHSVLIKVEHGKEKVLELFRLSIINFLSGQNDLDVIVIFDQDGKGLKDLEKLLQRTRERSENIDFVRTYEKLISSPCILLHKYNVVKKNGDKPMIPRSCSFLMFCSSLEKAAGVDKVKDRKEERQRKICALAESLLGTELRQFFK